MSVVRLILLISVGFLLLVSPEMIVATSADSFVTIVHPVRSRSLWTNPQVQTLIDHMKLTESRNLPATFLLQYDILQDDELVKYLQSPKNSQEFGLLLEVSEQLATAAFVPYTIGSGDWARPDKAFFSGYTLAQRQRLVDRLVRKFIIVFGHTPQVVGAWHIDPQTLKYLKYKYGIEAAVVVSDQYSTDHYQSWGKYYGVPYYPSFHNSLVPAQSLTNKLDVVIIQWAQRDLYRGYGEGVDSSTWSLQANDYSGNHQLSTDYFRKLFDTYKKSGPGVYGQITVGLEVGQETRFLPELANQIAYIEDERAKKNVTVISISDFAKWYKRQFPGLSPDYLLATSEASPSALTTIWYMSPWYRVNIVYEHGEVLVRDLREFHEEYTERDYLYPDKRTTLFRSVPAIIDGVVLKNELRLFSGVADMMIQKSENEYRLHIKGYGEEGTILLSPKSLVSQNFSFAWRPRVEDNIRQFTKAIIWPLLEVAERSEPYLPAVLYSEISGKKIIGFPSGQDELMGLTIHPLMFSRLNYPFQTLAHFKRFPRFSNTGWFVNDAASQARNRQRQENLGVLFPRGSLSIDAIRRNEEAGMRRVLENSEYSLWIMNEEN